MASGRIRGHISAYRDTRGFRTQDTGLFLHSFLHSFAPVTAGAANVISADKLLRNQISSYIWLRYRIWLKCEALPIGMYSSEMDNHTLMSR